VNSTSSKSWKRNSILSNPIKPALGILSLSKKIGSIRLDNACKRALGYEKYSLAMIKSILERGLDNLTDDDAFFEEKKLPKHKNIRGGKYYQ
jgi:hypothetical protein